MSETNASGVARREFLAWAGSSSLAAGLGLAGCGWAGRRRMPETGDHRLIQNVFHLRELAEERLGHDAYAYLAGGADDLRTVAANEAGYRELTLRARRLVDVSEVDTTVKLLGWTLSSPILISPVGLQAVFHPDAELATARAAAARGHRMFVSSASTFSVNAGTKSGSSSTRRRTGTRRAESCAARREPVAASWRSRSTRRYLATAKVTPRRSRT
jgi:hypothetical protein